MGISARMPFVLAGYFERFLNIWTTSFFPHTLTAIIPASSLSE